MKRTVRAALRVRASRAPLIAARTSAVPEFTAESCTSRAPVSAAMSRASVVLPQPGGPKKIMLKSCPPSTAARSTVPGPTMCSCPANSASVRGRMRAASGASACTWSSLREKRSSMGRVYASPRPTLTRAFLLPCGTMRKVLVLNTTYEPLNVCSVRRALILLLKDKAEMLENPARPSTASTSLPRPAGHPSHHLRARAAQQPVRTHLPASGVRARPAPLPVLRQPAPPHGRPRRAALQGRARHVGQPRHVVRAVQPQEGRPAARTSPACGSRGRHGRPARPRSSCSTWTTCTRAGART